MQVKPLRRNLEKYLVKHGIKRKFNKQLALFTINIKHPSLHTERLEPRDLKLYSFRIDLKYRAIFILLAIDEVEIIDINDHYQ